MLRGTSLKRMALVAAIAATGVGGVVQPVHAGPLCDWLFGRRQAPAAPVVVGFPVHSGNPYTVGFAPAVSVPHTAGFAMAPMSAPMSGVAVASPTMPLSGAAALQMPPYSAGFGSLPAVPATGPGDRGYVTFSPPPGTQFPVAPAPVTSFFGTGNVYPTTDFGQTHQVGFGAVAPSTGWVPSTGWSSNTGVAPVAAFQAPIVTNPSTVQTHPGIPAAQPGVLGGMSRFFGNMFGTGYSSSYNRVPVTYFRPVTSFSPATGATTVVQQPCTSYEQQLQRSPVTTFFPGQTQPVVPQAAPCAPAINYYNPYAGSNVVPATAYDSVPQSAFPPSSFPSTVQPGQYYGPPATGAIAPGTSGGGMANPDQVEIGQPQLQSSSRPIVIPQTAAPYTTTPQNSAQPSSPYGDASLSAPPTTPPATSWWSQSAMRSGMVESEALEKKNSLMAPPLQPESGWQSSSATTLRSELRPLPADAYPYQQQYESRSGSSLSQPAQPGTQQDPATLQGPSTRSSQQPFESRTFEPKPSEPKSSDRVASIQASQGQVGQAWGYKPIQWTVSQASYETEAPYAPPVNRPQAQNVQPASEVEFGLGRRSSANVPAATPVPTSQPRSYSEYESSGWTTKPRR